MIDALDEIDWSALDHAYGHATDTPGLIRQLRKDDWSDAVEELHASILHEGGLYSATLAALPFLCETALDPQAQGRIGALQLLSVYGRSVAAGGGSDAPRLQARAQAALQESAGLLLPLADDPDPEVRIVVYACAGHWPGALVRATLRERLGREDDRSARVALMEPLARHGLLRPDDLAAIPARDQDEVTFAALWCALAAGIEMPSLPEQLARLWPEQAPAYPGSGASNSLALLVQQAGTRVLPLLQILAERTASGLDVDDLAYAWCDLAQISRSATPSAVDALIALAGREESSDPATASVVVAALAAVLPAADGRRTSMADALADLLTRVSTRTPIGPVLSVGTAVPAGSRAGALLLPGLHASVAWLLFALQDGRWAAAARTAVVTGERLMVSTGLNSTTSFPVQLARVCEQQSPLWAGAELVEVATLALRARPAAGGSWAEVLGQLPPDVAVLQALLDNLSVAPEPAVLKALAQLAATVPGLFTAADRRRVAGLAPLENESVAWHLTVLHRLEPDPERFGQVWELARTTLDADELLRIWADQSSPALEQACQEQFTGRSHESFPQRHLQLAAASIVLDSGDPDALRALWPTVQAVVDRAGEPLRSAVRIAMRMVRAVPQLRPAWVAQLRDILEHGRQTWSRPDHVATALAVRCLTELGELTAEKAVERVLALEAEAVRAGRAVQVTPLVAGVLETVLSERPDLRPGVAAALGPLIERDERIPAPVEEIATDLYLVRVLQNAVLGVTGAVAGG